MKYFLRKEETGKLFLQKNLLSNYICYRYLIDVMLMSLFIIAVLIRNGALDN